MNRRRLRKVIDYARTRNRRLMTEALEHAYAELRAIMFGQGEPVFPKLPYLSHTVGPDFSAPPQTRLWELKPMLLSGEAVIPRELLNSDEPIEVFGDEIRRNTRMRVEYGHPFQVIRFDVDEEKEKP